MYRYVYFHSLVHSTPWVHVAEVILWISVDDECSASHEKGDFNGNGDVLGERTRQVPRRHYSLEIGVPEGALAVLTVIIVDRWTLGKRVEWGSKYS